MLTTDLVAYLLTQTAVTAIVGTRIQPIPAPEDLSQYPVVTYQQVSYVPEYSNDGPINVSQSRIVFECHAVRYLDAHALAQAVAESLSGFSGTLPIGTKVYLAEIANRQDQFNTDARIYSAAVHVLVQYAG